MISGRTGGAVDAALSALRRELPGADLHGLPCDMQEPAQVQALWDAAEKSLGRVDHWINNAGIGQPQQTIWDLDPGTMEKIVRTDLLGVLYGARVAMRGMMRQKQGAIWFMEGHGSDDRIMKGLSVYGASKRALRYVARALAVEARGTGVRAGAISPGIMITDFTMNQIDRAGTAAWERTKKIFNILGDKPETVASFLVPRILSERKNGALIAWLTTGKILWRFATAGMARRKVIDE
jgi:NAD(P)-dependent dehydrogenase (short-subunit alcohol dehydrogenase family)